MFYGMYIHVLLFDATVLDLNLLFNSFDISSLYLYTSVCIILGIIEKIQACEINITKTSIKIQVYQPTQLMIYTSCGWTVNEMFNV